MTQDRSDYKQYLTQAVRNPKYMNGNEIKKILNRNEIILAQEDIDTFSVKGPREYLNTAINVSNDNEIINHVEEFEFEKGYKYGILYQINGVEVNDVIKKLCDEKKINFSDLDYYSDTLEMPSYSQGNESFDLKFSKIITLSSTGNVQQKFPVILTFFRDLNWILVKHDALENELLKNLGYVKLLNEVNSWIRQEVTFNFEEINLFPTFKYLISGIRNTPSVYPRMSIKYENLEDDQNGNLILRADDTESISFIDGIIEIVGNYSDELKTEIKEYIDDYEENALLKRAGIRWNDSFGGTKRKSKVEVMLRRVYSSNNKTKPQFIHIHYEFNNSLDRERINYVIKYLSENLQ